MPPPPWSPSAQLARPSTRAVAPLTSPVAAAVWELDLVTGALVWSEGMHRIAGSDPTATRPSMQWWTSLVVPADRARVRAWLLVVREGGRGSEEQFDLVGADGVQRRVHAWTEVEAGDDGEAARLFGSAVDISAASAVGHRDPLTDLATRHAVVAVLEREATEARRLRVPGGAVLAVVDLDRFSVLDDALGRDTGDALLVAAADRLRSAAPQGAVVARLDGDCFAVVVGRTGGLAALASGAHHAAAGPDASGLAERLLGALRRPTRIPGRTEHVTLTASVGLVTTSGAETDPEDLLRHAGLALRRAKRDGGDRVVHYTPGLGEAALHRVQTETMLRSALDAERLRVLYQPVIDMRTGEVVGVEALARVIDPERGAISPALFVDVAEETGLVVRLDEWVLGRASTMAQQWAPPASGAPTTIALPETATHPGLPTVAVNMSSKTLQRPDLAGLVRGALQRSGSDPARLLVEITEHSLLDQGDSARDTLDGLTDLGVAVGIDDFGTGWSALSYLSALDLAFMKVDRAFVSRLGIDASASAVVQAVIDLAHAHHLTVIAEGIETEEQARMLIAMGCDHGQGYWFGRPTAEEDLDDAIRAWHARARLARFGAWAAAPAVPPARAALVPAAPKALSLRP